MNSTKTQAVIWVLTLIATARLVYAAVQHHMPILDCAFITVAAGYGFRTAFESVAVSVRRARTEASR